MPTTKRLLLLKSNLRAQRSATSKVIDQANFNGSLDHLSPTIIHLTVISRAFNQPVNRLPPNLRSLTIDSPVFNQSLNHLPPTLRLLQVTCGEYHHSIDSLPAELETFIWNSRQMASLPARLPATLRKYHFTNPFIPSDQVLGELPPNLTDLLIDCDTLNFDRLTKLPDHLQSMLFFSNGTGTIPQVPMGMEELELFVECNQLPEGFRLPGDQLRALRLSGPLFNHLADQIPSSVTVLMIEDDFDHPLDKVPRSVVDLTINSSGFNQPLDPLAECTRLTRFKLISAQFNRPVTSMPTSLEYLRLKTFEFDQSLDNLNEGLRELRLTSNAFRQAINRVPSTLTYLTVKSEQRITGNFLTGAHSVIHCVLHQIDYANEEESDDEE